jgi:hypothetical protein
VDISNIEALFAGTLVITQRVGNPWRGEAESRIEFPVHLSGAEELEYVIPVYDFIHPLQISLLGEKGETLAEDTKKLRAYRQEGPFPLAVGAFPQPISTGTVTIDPEDLPYHWPAYETISALWIGRIDEGVSNGQWKAIGQWVLAGGTLILFTGSDFYLLDCPSMRALLPLYNPSVLDTNDAPFLQGQPLSGARTLLTRKETPLVVEQRYGAGKVFLVTISAFDLMDAELSAINEYIPTAGLFSFGQATKELLEATSLARPGHLAAILLVLGSLSCFTLVVTRARGPRQTLLMILGASIILCVLSGFYADEAKYINNVVVLKTGLRAKTSFEIDVACYGLFGITDGPGLADLGASSASIQEIPRSLREHDYRTDSKWGEGTQLFLSRGESRFISSLGEGDLPITVVRSADKEVRIENGLDGPLEALVTVNGTAYPIGKIRAGDHTYELQNGVPLDEAELSTENFMTLYRVLIQDFCLGKGTWLVGMHEGQSVNNRENTRIKMRELTLLVVAEGDYD